MPNPSFTNRWNKWQKVQPCGTCECEGSCTIKAGETSGGITQWCVESFACHPGCRCYCLKRDANGNLVTNCGDAPPPGTMRVGMCFKCVPAGFTARTNGCEGETHCTGHCLFRYMGSWEEHTSSCFPASVDGVPCRCPPPPAGPGIIGEFRRKGPCESAPTEEEEE
jgi:hypothetical protein